MLKTEKINPTEVRARLAIVCATYAEPMARQPLLRAAWRWLA